MRELFWKELNKASSNKEVKHWQGIFPEAAIINFETLLNQSQYISRLTGHDTIMDNYCVNMPNVENNKHIKPFFTEFVTNYTSVEGDVKVNCSFFWSLSDNHSSLHMHRDLESVLLIQGYGEVCIPTTNEEADNYKIQHLKIGDALFLPRLLPHKAIPLSPRVTLSIGANPLSKLDV
jgi:hypothetical protein